MTKGNIILLYIAHPVKSIRSGLRHKLVVIWGLPVTCLVMLILVLIFFCEVIYFIEFLLEEFVWTTENVELCTWMILVLEYDIRANLRDLGF